MLPYMYLHVVCGVQGGGVAGGGASSTTMIFGSLSEDLLKTILQRLQEIYAEILTNRVTGTEASR